MKAKNVILITTLLLCCITVAIFSSCVKQKDCEGCEEGTLIVLEKPVEYISSYMAYAYFYSNSRSIGIPICNKLPAKYAKKDTVKVCVVLKDDARGHPTSYIPPLKITCIEEIEN